MNACPGAGMVGAVHVVPLNVATCPLLVTATQNVATGQLSPATALKVSKSAVGAVQPEPLNRSTCPLTSNAVQTVGEAQETAANPFESIDWGVLQLAPS